jgi:hypothetical protein
VAWMNSAPRGHEATAARGAMISASVDIGGDDRESPSIGADQRRRDVQANADSLTPHRINSGVDLGDCVRVGGPA